MRSSIVKMALAAAVVLAGIGGVVLVSSTKSVALADVLAKVEQVQAFSYKMTVHTKGSLDGAPMPDTNMTASTLVANEYGVKIDVISADVHLGGGPAKQIYLLPRQRTFLVLMPMLKKYVRVQGDEKLFEAQRRENNDPRVLLKKILECGSTDLGRTVLDGVEVQGFRTTDPAYGNGFGAVDITVWVSVKTGLPVRLDTKTQIDEHARMEGTLCDFQWDVPVSEEQFNPVIPPDFTAAPGDGLQMPAPTEATALAGLKRCRELRGKYPDDLNLMTLLRVVTERITGEGTPEAQALWQRLEQGKSQDERTKAALDIMMQIQAAGGFYTTLVQEKKEPVYYGKMVQPGDVAQVLLRWKTGENEYRVIFADLHAETVNADTLATLEGTLPK